ncbi:MAG TPA: hypothetical protein VH639_18935 [Bryobacteraceae bacterium]
MGSAMLPCHGRDIFDAVAGQGRAAAKVHIFEPDGEKAFIEPPQPLPNIATEHQESTGRLFYRARQLEIPVQITIFPVHRIAGPKPIEAQKL